MKNSPISAKATSPRKPIKGEVQQGQEQRLQTVKNPTESTLAAASSRSMFRSACLQSLGCFEACRELSWTLATFRAVSQSLSNARTGTAHPAACRRCASCAMTIECPPCQRIHHPSPYGCLEYRLCKFPALPHSPVPLPNRCRRGWLSASVRCFAGRSSPDMQTDGQALPVDLPGHRFHDKLLHQEDPRRDRWRRKLLGQGSDSPGSPSAGAGRTTAFRPGDRWCADEGDQFLVLIVQHSGLDFPNCVWSMSSTAWSRRDDRAP